MAAQGDHVFMVKFLQGELSMSVALWIVLCHMQGCFVVMME
jgi:hypothetical protein